MRRLRNHKQWARALVAAALLAMLATGCIKAEIDIKVDDDGSGDVSLLSALDTNSLFGVLAEMDIPEESAGSSDDLCNEFIADTNDEGFPADAQVEPYEEDGFCGTRITYALQPLTDQSIAISPVFEGSGSRLYKEGENWFFDVPLDLSDVTEDSGEVPDEMFNAMFEDASFTVTLDLPGRAVDGENNATSVGSDGKFEWEIDFLNAPDRLFAQTEPGSGGGSGGGFPMWILGLIALLALAGAGAWWLTKRGNDDAAASLDGYPPAGDLSTQGIATPGADAFAGGQQAPVGLPPQGQAEPQPYAPPVQPANPSAQETVMLDPGATAAAATPVADAAASATPAADAGATASAAAKPAPVFDEELGAWIVNHPEHGRLMHDPDTDTWRPA